MRMRHHPEGTQLLYDALKAGDFDLAHKIAVKHDFHREGRTPLPKPAVKKRTVKRYDYWLQRPNQETKYFPSLPGLAKELGISKQGISLRLIDTNETQWYSGKLDGVRLWRTEC